jgi:hypothetical protein
MTQVIIQYDSIEPSTIPSDAVAVAGYVGGSWPDYSQLVAEFPNARHKSIAVNASEDADILDIEAGDAVPSDAPGWFRRQKARGLVLPGFYSDASGMPSVIAELHAAGIFDGFVLWVAHLGPQPTPPFEQGAKAIQFTFNALGRNLDASACTEDFWSILPPPPVVNPQHYDWFENAEWELHGEKVNERQTVEAYDKLRAHVKTLTHAEAVELALLRVRLLWLAERVWYVSHNPLKNGKATFGLYHRGWRWQQLIHRAHGMRFV